MLYNGFMKVIRFEVNTGIENMQIDRNLLENAISSVYGVYCICDRATGKLYIGSSYSTDNGKKSIPSLGAADCVAVHRSVVSP